MTVIIYGMLDALSIDYLIMVTNKYEIISNLYSVRVTKLKFNIKHKRNNYFESINEYKKLIKKN